MITMTTCWVGREYMLSAWSPHGQGPECLGILGELCGGGQAQTVASTADRADCLNCRTS